MMLLITQRFRQGNRRCGRTSWLRALVGLRPLPTWERAQLLFNNFAIAFGLKSVSTCPSVLPLTPRSTGSTAA